MKRIVNLFFILVIVSCASKSKLVDDAKIYMQHKKWKQARKVLVSHLRTHPGDVEAKILKSDSEEQILKGMLLRLRDFNSAGNFEGALGLAHKIYDKRKKWNVVTDINGAQFEISSLKSLYTYFNKRVQSHLVEKHPLKAKEYFDKHSFLFEVAVSDGTRRTQANIQKYGQEKCQNFARQRKGNTPYYNSFVDSYCQLFGSGVQYELQGKTNIEKELYNDVRISFQRANKFKEDERDILRGKVREAFRKSVWYHPEATKIMSLKVSGKRTYSQKTNVQFKYHLYTVKKPYKSYETVQKSRRVPYLAQVKKCVSNVGITCYYNSNICSCRMENVRKYKTEYYSQRQAVTKFKNATETQGYKVTKYRRNHFVSIEGDLYFENKKLNVSHSQSKFDTDVESFVDMPKIGLKAQKLSILGETDWLIKELGKYSNYFVQRTDSFWQAKYCNNRNAKRSMAYQGNNVMACMKLKGPSYHFVRNWIKQITGLEGDEVSRLLLADKGKI